jgi:predicted DNA binding CopG/RHH family protein
MRDLENEEYIGFRVSRQLKDALRRKAMERGTTLSELLRELLRKEVRTWTHYR